MNFFIGLFLLFISIPIIGQTDIELSEQLVQEIQYAYDEFDDSGNPKPYLDFLENKRKAFNSTEYPITKSWVFVSLYFFEFSITENFAKASGYIDSLILLYPHIPECSDLSILTLNCIGTNQEKKGNYADCISTYLSALHLETKCGLEDPQTPLLNNIAIAYSRLGDFSKAIEYHKLDLKKIKQFKNSKRVLKSDGLAAIARSYFRNRQYLKSQEYFDKSIGLLSGHLTQSEKKSKLKSLLHLSEVLLQREEFELATLNLERARLIKPTEFPDYRFHYTEALIYEANGKIELGKEKISKALIGIESHMSGRSNAAILSSYFEKAGDIHRSSIDSSLNFYVKGLETLNYNKIPHQSREHLDVNSFSNKLMALDILFKIIQLGKWQDEHTFDLLLSLSETGMFEINSQESKIYHKNRTKEIFQFIINWYYEKALNQGEQSYVQKAFEVSERGKSILFFQDLFERNLELTASNLNDSLLTQKRKYIQSKNALQVKLREYRHDENRDLVDVLTEELLSLNLDIEYLDTQLESNEYRFSSYLGSNYKMRASEHLDEVQIVEFFSGPDYLFAFNKIGENLELYRTEYSKGFIEDIDALHASLSNDSNLNNKEFANLSFSIKENFFPFPLNKEGDIWIVVDGPLSVIPFEALLDALPENISNMRSWPFLINEHRFRYVNSLKEIISKKIRKNTSVLAIAPEYKGSLKLINNVQEVESINNHFKVKSLFDEAAIKSNFIKFAPLHNVIHIAAHATHALSSDEDSYILFADDEDGASELYDFEIKDLELDCGLLVLSACETGTGEIVSGEGSFSIARNFMIAGARNVLCSIWKADDQVSASMMQSFYSNYKQSKNGPEALRAAKLNFLSKADNFTAHPKFWSGWTFIEQYNPRREKMNPKMSLVLSTIGIVLLSLFAFLYLRKSFSN